MRRTDLVVLGGGPAGATVATLAAKQGARVMVIEKDGFPRDKVCGEFLSAEGCAVITRLGLMRTLRSQGALPIDACVLADRKGRSVESPLPMIPDAGRSGLGVSRAALDAAILAHAASCGAIVRERTTATRPVLENGRLAGVIVRPTASASGEEEIRAALVIAADGRRSMLQRALAPSIGDPLATSARSWFGFGTHFPDPTNGLSGRIELFVFDGGYVGLGPIECCRLNLALIATVMALRACGNSPQRLFEERMLANPLLRERLAGASPCAAWRAVGPLRFNVRRPASHGAMFLGDAAGTIDPCSGEGMSNALRGAELAVPFVMDALAAGHLSDPAAQAWSGAWRRAFAPVTRRARIVGRIFEHPRPAAVAMTLLKLPQGARMLPSLVAATRTGLRAV